jgi:hypothetical protein
VLGPVPSPNPLSPCALRMYASLHPSAAHSMHNVLPVPVLRWEESQNKKVKRKKRCQQMMRSAGLHVIVMTFL